VGQSLRRFLRAEFASIRILDLTDPGDLAETESWSKVDICDLDALSAALQGVDAIVHLAGYPGERPIEDIIRVNVIGTHNLYEAARMNGVRRIVLGSSNHATGFYRRDRRITPDHAMRPDSFYGLSKCWNELEAGLYFEKFGITTLIIRIGNATIEPGDPRSDARSHAIWVSPRDLAALVMIGLEHPDIDCTTVYGVSRGANDWWDNSVAVGLGYRPVDSADGFAALQDRNANEGHNVADRFQGGRFCAKDHDGVLRHRRCAQK
jgi:uronate dehydrogenase